MLFSISIDCFPNVQRHHQQRSWYFVCSLVTHAGPSHNTCNEPATRPVIADSSHAVSSSAAKAREGGLKQGRCCVTSRCYEVLCIQDTWEKQTQIGIVHMQCLHTDMVLTDTMKSTNWYKPNFMMHIIVSKCTIQTMHVSDKETAAWYDFISWRADVLWQPARKQRHIKISTGYVLLHVFPTIRTNVQTATGCIKAQALQCISTKRA